MEEIWKPVKGYEEIAEISNYGQVHFYGNGRGKYPNERWTWGSEDNCGYLRVSIGGSGAKGIHRWVFETFVGNIPQGMEVNHIDENPKNNRIDNLNLMTHKQNNNYGTHNAKLSAALKGKKRSEETKRKIAETKKGVNNNRKLSKPVFQLNKENGEIIAEFPSINEVKRRLGFCNSNISECCMGKRKTAYGFKWEYKKVS